MAKTKIVRKNANWRRSEANGQVISFFFSNCISLLFIHPYKSTSQSTMESKMDFPDYMLTNMYFINNFKHLLLSLSGYIEVNPGDPKRSSNIKFKRSSCS